MRCHVEATRIVIIKKRTSIGEEWRHWSTQTLLADNQEKWKHVHTKPCRQMFIAALFIMAQTGASQKFKEVNK